MTNLHNLTQPLVRCELTDRFTTPEGSTGAGWLRASIDGRADEGGYVHATAAFGDELGRLRLLEARCDPHTFRRLSTFGPLAGAGAWRWAPGPARWPAGWPPRPDPVARS